MSIEEKVERFLYDLGGWSEGLVTERRRERLYALLDDAREEGPSCCDWRHEWPCPTIPRCWVEGCGKEATCGYPCAAHRYHRSCGKHFEMREQDA